MEKIIVKMSFLYFVYYFKINMIITKIMATKQALEGEWQSILSSPLHILEKFPTETNQRVNMA